MPTVNNATLHVSRSFGGIAKKLEAIPVQASAEQLKQILDNGWASVAVGETLSKGESAWLQILAEHPNANAELRKEIAAKVAALTPSATASAAHADVYFKDLLEQPAPQAGHVIGSDTSGLSGFVQGKYSRQQGKKTLTALGLLLANADVAVNPFGSPARGMAQLDEQMTREQLGRYLESEWPKIADHQEASSREISWLVNMANHPAADASLRLKMADKLETLPLQQEAQQRGAQIFIDQLRAFPDAKEVQLNAWYFGALPADAPKIPGPEASEADLLALVSGNWGQGGDDGTLDEKELAFFDALARHPKAGKNFATALMTRLAGQGVSIKARRRGAIPFMMQVLAKTNMKTEPPVESDKLDLGPMDASLPDPSQPVDANGLNAMFAANVSKIRRGGWVSRGEAAWMQALAQRPEADRALLTGIADLLVKSRPTKDLRDDSAVFMEQIKAQLDALPPAPDPVQPDPNSPTSPFELPSLGKPSTKLDKIPKKADLAQLKALFAANQGRIGRGGKWLNSREAAWLISLAQQPSADDAFVGQVLDYARSLKPTKKAKANKVSAHLDALEMLHKIPGGEIALTQLAHTLALVREVATRAAGTDRVLSADELKSAIAPLNKAEQAAINKLFDNFKKSIGDAPLTVPVILAHSQTALKELKAADANGDLKLDRKEMVGLLALNASVVDLNRQLLADHGPAGATYRRFDYSKMQGAQLREAIRDWNGLHHVLSYGNARKAMFSKIDNVDGEVRGVYTGRKVQTDKIPESQGPLGMNTEHTMPKARGVRDTDAISDLHHLFPTDSLTNAKRSSYPFGLVEKTIWQRAGSKLGTDKDGRMVFEPPAEHRGDVARALFYVSTVYELPLSEQEEQTLRAWNIQDPVTDAERQRNDAIDASQGNRNPFVDDASLADKIQDF